jgi:hypothetical protein
LQLIFRCSETDPTEKVEMNCADILEALRELTARESFEFLPLAPDPEPFGRLAT